MRSIRKYYVSWALQTLLRTFFYPNTLHRLSQVHWENKQSISTCRRPFAFKTTLKEYFSCYRTEKHMAHASNSMILEVIHMESRNLYHCPIIVRESIPMDFLHYPII